MNFNRIYAVVLRHLYYLKHSWEQISDSFYWPAIDLIVWGLTSKYFQTTGQVSNIMLIVLTGLIFWQVVWRSQYEITVSFLAEIWSKNVVVLFASPLTINEWIVAVIILGIIKMVATLFFIMILTWILYSVNLFTFGFTLLPFFGLLLFSGWWVGLLVVGIIMRIGNQAQTLAWAGVALLAPFSAVYYPLSSLPLWAQKMAGLVPTSYLFEGMRVVIATGIIPWTNLIYSFFISTVYLVMAVYYIKWSFNKACQDGLAKLDEG